MTKNLRTLILFIFVVLGRLVQADPFAVSPHEFQKALKDKRLAVPEIKIIRKILDKYKVRGWLLGGSGSTLCHYVIWDLRHQKGDLTFHPLMFDYQLPSIYRRAQDLDVVVDAQPDVVEKIQREFESALPETLPGLIGDDKPRVETRILRHTYQRKVGILDDTQFFHQHSDSESNLLLEITDPPSGESIARDARDWTNQGMTPYLQALFANQLIYFHSSKHQQTPRAKKGTNPSIMSVLRYFAKKHQFRLSSRPEDEKKLMRIARRFQLTKLDLEHEGRKEYVIDRFRRLGIKIVLDALDMEEAWDSVQKIGVLNNTRPLGKAVGSLYWFYQKAPLRTFPQANVPGKTAEEVGLSQVVVLVDDLYTYDSLLHSPNGLANFYLSTSARKVGDKVRTVVTGYAPDAVPTESGLPIIVQVNSKAIANRDFRVEGQKIHLANKATLHVEYESLIPSYETFLELLDSGRLKDLDAELVTLIRLKASKHHSPSAETLYQTTAAMMGKTTLKAQVLYHWIHLHESAHFVEPTLEWLRKLPTDERNQILKTMTPLPHWRIAEFWQIWLQESPELLKDVLQQPDLVAALPLELYPKLIEDFVSGLKKTKAHGGGYLSKNGNHFMDFVLIWLPHMKPDDWVVGCFTSTLSAFEQGKITNKDLRRMLARILGSVTFKDSTVKAIEKAFGKNELIHHTFQKYTGTFTESRQSYSHQLSQNFAMIAPIFNLCRITLIQ